MAQIDRSNDRLKLCAAEDWSSPPHHPDGSPPQEAVLLKEGLVEAARNLAADYDSQFVAWMNEAACAPVWIAESLDRNSLGFSWSACTVAVVFGGVGMMVRFLRGRWKRMRVIEAEPASGRALGAVEPEAMFEAARE